MKLNRRNFLRNLTIGAGAFTIGLPSFAREKRELSDNEEINDYGKQRFNLCGYAAPKMELVKIGVVGLGMRGSDAVERLSYIDGVEIVRAFCCAGIPCYISREQKPIEKLKLKLRYTVEIYSFSPIKS